MSVTRVLVTGAGGFIGANLVRRLVADGHDVIAVSRPGCMPWRLQEISAEIQILELDLRDAVAIAPAVAEARPEWIFHLAAHGAYSWQTDMDTMVRVNILATDALLASARAVDVQAFVNAGSSSEYGLKTHAPSESERLEPNSHYAITKAAGTHLTALAAANGLAASTLRLYSVYGPWEDPGRLIPALMREAARGKLPPLVGPETARDFLYVDDCCDALLSVAKQGASRGAGVILNLGSGQQTRLDELIDEARSTLGVSALPEWGTMSQRGWDTNVWVSDPRVACQMLGWKASTSLSDGLRRTADWLRAHPALWDRYEILTI